MPTPEVSCFHLAEVLIPRLAACWKGAGNPLRRRTEAGVVMACPAQPTVPSHEATSSPQGTTQRSFLLAKYLGVYVYLYYLLLFYQGMVEEGQKLWWTLIKTKLKWLNLSYPLEIISLLLAGQTTACCCCFSIFPLPLKKQTEKAAWG